MTLLGDTDIFLDDGNHASDKVKKLKGLIIVLNTIEAGLMSPLFLRVKKVGGLSINKLNNSGRLASVDKADVLGVNPFILLIIDKREGGVKQVLINLNNSV